LEPDRDYWWIVVTDADHELDETDETNNVRISGQPTRVLSQPVLRVLTVAWDGDLFAVQVLTLPGRLYSLDYKDRIEDPSWNRLVEVSGDGTVRALSDPSAAQTTRFYRIRMD
jgi:hypothetical protein